VLIYRLGSLGDTVVALPSLHLIARRFPDAERRMLTNIPVHAKAPAASAVLGESGLVHGYMRYTAGTRRIDELLRVMLEVRRFRPDLLVFLMDLRRWKLVKRDMLFFRLCGVRRIVGVPGEQAMERGFDATTGLYESEAHRLARLIAELGDARPGEAASWDLRLTSAERRAGNDALGDLAGRPLIVCGPGTKMQAKDWGAENWRALLGRLGRAHPEHGLALVGASEDAQLSESAAQEWTGRKVNLCGRLSPRETAAVLERAEVFLGPDSGPMHLAASVGTPCVIAFSARGLPGVWFPTGTQHEIAYRRPDCAGCGLETCIENERKCLRLITVAEMELAAGRVLQRVERASLRLVDRGRAG
jgi:ADP-heptose:LPS heptosyltransferase